MPQKRTIGTVVAVIGYVVSTAVLARIYGNESLVISAMASVALVIVTAALVLATYAYTEAASRQVVAMNKQALAQEEQVRAAAAQVEALAEQVQAANKQVAALTDPVIFFGEEEFESSTISQFFVQNVGPGIAYDVKFNVRKDSEQKILLFDQKLSDLAFIKTPIKTLAPGQKIPFAILDSNKNLLSETLEVEVSYKNRADAKEPFTQLFPIDFAYQQGMRQVRRTVTSELKRIADSMGAKK